MGFSDLASTMFSVVGEAVEVDEEVSERVAVSLFRERAGLNFSKEFKPDKLTLGGKYSLFPFRQ